MSCLKASKNREAPSRRRTFQEQFRLTSQLVPALVPVSVLAAVFKSAVPFINIFMMARIVDALAQRQTYTHLCLLAVITVAANLVVTSASRGLEQWKGILQQRLDRMEMWQLARTVGTTDYPNVEDPAFHLKQEKVVDAMMTGERRGFGMGATHLSAAAGSLFTVICATLLSFSYFFPSTGSGRLGMLWPLISLGLLLLLAVSSVISVKGNAKFSQKMFRALDDSLTLNRQFGYYLGRLREIAPGKDARLYRQSGLILKYFADYLDKVIKYTGGLGRLRGRLSSAGAFGSTLLAGLLYFIVGFKAILGGCSIGSVLQVVGGLTQFTTGLSALIVAISDLWLNLEYVQMYLDYIHTPSMQRGGNRRIHQTPDGQHEIEFRHVTFHYPGTEKNVLYDISLKLPVGCRLALVGRNGSGKTTFVKLLCRLYEPTEGEILLDGYPLKEYDYDDTLRLYSVVFQDFKLFAFAAGQNVAAGLTVDREKAANCLKAAGLFDRIAAMPKGLDTPLYREDDEGVEISGGEAQKLALARALYKGAPFVVLDEPTAALDPMAELEVYAGFDNTLRGKTAVYVSHRLASCRFCDEIVVFRGGRLVQRGTHERLLKDEGGDYAALWNAQAQYYT